MPGGSKYKRMKYRGVVCEEVRRGMFHAGKRSAVTMGISSFGRPPWPISGSSSSLSSRIGLMLDTNACGIWSVFFTFEN